MGNLAGKVAVVTGASRGIGQATATALVEAGAHVALCARSGDALDRVAQELADRGPGRVMSRVVDVRDPDACAAFIEAVVEELGGLDILVNNAGLGIFAPIQEMSIEDWRTQIDTNLGGVFYLSKAAVPHLSSARDGGWIINVGSLASRNSFAGGAGYNASKFGLLGMTEAMMLDLRYDNIRVSIVMPGSVATAFAGPEPGPESDWKLTSQDVARAILDLLTYPSNALASRIELRPSRPPRR